MEEMVVVEVSPRVDEVIDERLPKTMTTVVPGVLSQSPGNQAFIAPVAKCVMQNTQKILGELKAFGKMNEFMGTGSGFNEKSLVAASPKQKPASATPPSPITPSEDEALDSRHTARVDKRSCAPLQTPTRNMNRIIVKASGKYSLQVT